MGFNSAFKWLNISQFLSLLLTFLPCYLEILKCSTAFSWNFRVIWLAEWIRQECSSVTRFQLPRQLIDEPTRHGDRPNYMALSILNKLRSGNRCSGIRWRLAM